MIIKNVFNFTCVLLMLALFLASCAESSKVGDGSNTNGGGDNGSNTNGGGVIEASNVSAENCADDTLNLNCFISVWNTENTPPDADIIGFSDLKKVKFPLVSNGAYNFYVDWGDGSDVQHITNYSEATHTYETGGIYTIYIAGVIKGWRFYADKDNYGDAVKLLDIEQWGSFSFGKTEGAQFLGAIHFNPTATDAPDLSETTNLRHAFAANWKFNPDVSHWDVSKASYMSYMFHDASIFNNKDTPLNWGSKVSNVQGMRSMFQYAYDFNQDISGWDVSQVVDMSFMFDKAASFNNGGEALNWGSNVGKVQSMHGMFQEAAKFNQDVSMWDVSKVTNMYCMFNWATSFNNDGEALDWRSKVGNVETMVSMFQGAKAFNQDISGWDVSQVKNMTYMFQFANSFNNGGAALDWGKKVENVTNMWIMFRAATNFNQDISDWDVSEVTDMSFMFQDADKFNQDISDWDVSKVNDMPGMFRDADIFNNGGKELDWGDKTSIVNDMKDMFLNANKFNADISSWDVSEVQTMEGMFFDANDFNQDVSSWDVSEVTNMSNMFYWGKSFDNGGEPLNWGRKTSKVNNMSRVFSHAYAFNQDISNWDVSAATNMRAMFSYAKAFNQDISGWDVSQVTTMNSLFQEARRFNNNGKELDWDSKTSKVTNMADMFYAALDFNQNIKNWNVSQVTSMENMFFGATNFNNDGEALAWGDSTSSVVDMANMFAGATIFNQDISGWDVSEVTDMNHMFYGATDFNQDISDWNISKVTNINTFLSFASAFNNGGKALEWGEKTSNVADMKEMFYNAKAFSQDISDWDVSEVGNMDSMFRSASSFDQDISDWNISKVTNINSFLNSASAFNNSNEPLDWGEKTSAVTDMSFMFRGASSFDNSDKPLDWTVGQVKSFEHFAAGSALDDVNKPAFKP